MDLSPFLAINPCGYAGMVVTQTRDHGVNLSPEQAGEGLVTQLVKQLEMRNPGESK
jgi:lipoyl(octanoyl) transferase